MGTNLTVDGKAVPFKNACDYVSQPGNSYGKPRSGLQPSKARRQSYNPTAGTENQGFSVGGKELSGKRINKP